MPTINDREEWESAAVLYAIERIDRFSFQRGSNAFAYYTSLIYRFVARQLPRERQRHSRAPTFSEICEPELRGIDETTYEPSSLPDFVIGATPYALAS